MLSRSVKETEKVAKVFLDKILTPVVEKSSLRGKKTKGRKGALVVALSGGLGAGKTAFTKAVAKHLRIKHTVNSPTFVIMKKYPIKLEGYNFLFHIDAYRLEREKELLHLGWEEIVNNEKHIIFIEWPENVPKIIPASAKFVYISADKNGHRTLKLK